MAGGVYEIVNLSNGKRYVGSAVDFEKRWRLHRLHLSRGTHHSRHLQSSWQKHGADQFAFRPLVICDRQNNVMYEQSAMNALQPELNVAPLAGSCLGIKQSNETRAKLSAAKLGNKHWLGRKHTAETLARMSEAHRGNTRTRGKLRDPSAVERTAAAHRGMKRSAETRGRISAAMTGKRRTPKSESTRRLISESLRGRRGRTEGDIRLIRSFYVGGSSVTEIATRFGLSHSMVSMIISGKRYGWVQ